MIRRSVPTSVCTVVRTALCTSVVAALGLVGLAVPGAFAQAQTPTTIAISGGSQGATQTLPAGQAAFGIRVPLRPNSENVLKVVATDTLGRTAAADDVRISQISLTEIVRAQVTAQHLTTQEIHQLVAEGAIDLADPSNYNVSRFVVALVVAGHTVQVQVPVARQKEEPFAIGEEVSIGCGSGGGVQTTERSISIPCGDGGSNVADTPPIQIIPFEIAIPGVPGEPSVPGVIIIEGRIKTLKEFFKVNLLMMNVSPLFTLTDLTATLEVPEGALTPVVPTGGAISIADLLPNTEGTGQFIVRGDLKGTHTVTAHFGGKITGAFLPEPVAFSGSASTDLEVKGPPKMDVTVSHPAYVTANVPYELRVEIRNTDPELDALYTSLAIDVGGDAELIDETTGLGQEGPTVRELGDILRGTSIVQTYRVIPHVTGPISSCVGAATENLTLAVAFTDGTGPGCAIGTLPSEMGSSDGRPTVTVVPSHNTTGVSVGPAITAIFSGVMIEQTITTGYPAATFTLLDPNNNVVPGSLRFTELFGATAAIFLPDNPLALDSTYTIQVRPDIFTVDGFSLASGMVAHFTTEGSTYVPDTEAPTLTIGIEAPHNPLSLQRGQLVPVNVTAVDNHGVDRVNLYLDGALIDAKHPDGTARFLVDTSALDLGTEHELIATALDPAGNPGQVALTIAIAPDATAPSVSLVVPGAIGKGRALRVEASAIDDVRVAHVALYLDSAEAPAATGMIAPFVFSLDTAPLSGGLHTLRVVATDGAGNSAEASALVEVTLDRTAPSLVVTSPIPGASLTPGVGLAVAALVTDDSAVASVAYFLDAEVTPRATGLGGAILSTVGLATGAHTMRVVATDASGNAAEAVVPFALVVTAGDTTPPAAPVLALLSAGTPTGGLVTIAGQAGAVDAGSRVEILNTVTSGLFDSVAAGTGAFSRIVEAAGGETVRLVAIDAAGNRSTPTDLVITVPATLLSIAVTPQTALLNRTQTSQPLTVTGTFSDGSQQTVTTGLTFTSSAPTVATATASGLLLPGQNGTATLTVGSTTPGVAPVPVAVTVDFSTIIGLTVTPTPLVIDGLGRNGRLTVQARFADSTTGAFGGVVRFATSNPNVAIVDPSGLVTSTGVGNATLTVSTTGYPSVLVPVVVREVQQTGIIVTPNAVSLTALGQSEALSVRYSFSDGTEGPAPTAKTFTSRNTSVATVDAGGIITATGEGSTLIDVQSLTFQTSVTVTVTVPSTLPPPEILSLGRPIAGEQDTVAILGRNFSGNPLLNQVTIGGLAADVRRAAFDRLVAVVPYGATTGQVQVRVGGQDSNTVPLAIYSRLATAVLRSTPFSSPGTGAADLGSGTFVIEPGDDLVVSGDPNLIVGAHWSGLTGPSTVGTLIVTIDGHDTVVANAAAPVNLTSLLGAVTAPRTVAISARLEAAGGQLSSQGIAVIAGPPATGAFTGNRYSAGDTIGQETTVRFRVNAPDGAKFAATAINWFRVDDGGCCTDSAGGVLLGGDDTPNDGRFRTYTVQNGEISITYRDEGLLSSFSVPRTATIALLPANAAGSRQGDRPVADAVIQLGALDSGSVIAQQPSVIADGAVHPITVDIDSVRDNFGNRVPDGARLAVTAANWYRRIDGGCCNSSAGGAVSGGDVTPNDGNFRTVTLAGGAAQVTYSPTGLQYTSTQTGTAVMALLVADAAGRRVQDRPLAEGSVALSAVSGEDAIATAVPATLTASSGDNRSVITVTGLTDASGRTLPDGTLVAVTAASWYRQSDGGCCNGSFGGTILDGATVPNDGLFRAFPVVNGTVTFTYSNQGLVLDRQATNETVIAILPANPGGSRLGTRPLAEARIVQAGVTSASIVATPSSTVADGTRRPVSVVVSNIRDAVGNIVPDGTRIALTAASWYRRSDGGCCNSSTGGSLIDGVTAVNDGNFQVYTVNGGRVDATFSPESVPLLGVTDVRSSVIAATVADTANRRVTVTPFAEGTLAVSSIATATAEATPGSLLGDRQDRRATVTITGLTDSQGRAIPDGTKVAITAASWYRLSDGGCCNGSVGGGMVGGEATPNDGSFRTYTVLGGNVTAVYSSAGQLVGTGDTGPVILSVLPATGSGSRIGTRPFAIASVTLAGMDSATVLAPAVTTPGSTVAVTLTNLRDSLGNLLPDGARVAVTAVGWYRRDGGCCSSSAGGAITGGLPTPNDGNFQSFVVNGGVVTVTFTAPATNNVTSVISVVPADGAGNRTDTRPIVVHSIRMQTGAVN